MAQEQMNTALRDLAPGERFCGVYLLKSAQTGVTSTGKPYLSFRLADLTGELPGKAWDYAGPLGGGDAGQSVWVRGRVELYQNALQAALEEIRLTDERDEVDPARLVPAAPHDPEKMLAYVRKTLEGLEDADYRAVCLAVLDRRQDAFAALPGGKTMHHSFRHGLLMHTANMMRQAAGLARIYADVIDRSLLIAGAFLHDIGKLSEYATSQLGLVSDYSREGQLLGHLFLGAEEVGSTARALGIAEEKTLLLQHLIVSHHGRAEFGAVVPPKCAEAELLANIDMIDSRMEIFREALADTAPGQFSKQRVYGQYNSFLYRHSEAGEPSPATGAHGVSL